MTDFAVVKSDKSSLLCFAKSVESVNSIVKVIDRAIFQSSIYESPKQSCELFEFTLSKLQHQNPE